MRPTVQKCPPGLPALSFNRTEEDEGEQDRTRCSGTLENLTKGLKQSRCFADSTQ